MGGLVVFDSEGLQGGGGQGALVVFDSPSGRSMSMRVGGACSLGSNRSMRMGGDPGACNLGSERRESMLVVLEGGSSNSNRYDYY